MSPTHYFKTFCNSLPTQNGLLSALPYLCGALVVVPAGWISDKAISTGRLTKGQARKLFQSLGMFLPAGCLVGIGYAGCDVIAIMIVMCVAITVYALTYAGIWASNKPFNIPHLF